MGNQRRTRLAIVQPQEPEDRAVEAGQQDQEVGQQPTREDPTVSPSQHQGN